MKKLVLPAIVIVLFIASAFTTLRFVDWKIKDGYSVKFSGGSEKGVFNNLKGQISFNEADPASSKINVTVDVSTFNTGNGMMNTHAKSPEWFDAEKFPVISFVSKSFAKKGAGYEVTGDLTMHGVTKQIVLPFTFTKAADGGVFASEFDVNRMDYGINTAQPNRGPSQVHIELSVPVTQ
jgi:polyisoprenoid-binding protein YceI